jgi:hypothetical protein
MRHTKFAACALQWSPYVEGMASALKHESSFSGLFPRLEMGHTQA